MEYELRGPVREFRLEGRTIIIGDDLLEKLSKDMAAKITADNRNDKFLEEALKNADSVIDENGNEISVEQYRKTLNARES